MLLTIFAVIGLAFGCAFSILFLLRVFWFGLPDTGSQYQVRWFWIGLVLGPLWQLVGAWLFFGLQGLLMVGLIIVAPTVYIALIGWWNS